MFFTHFLLLFNATFFFQLSHHIGIGIFYTGIRSEGTHGRRRWHFCRQQYKFAKFDQFAQTTIFIWQSTAQVGSSYHFYFFRAYFH
jgi:hypothetical protein